jgi:predicted O-methyltransferase YrrM
MNKLMGKILTAIPYIRYAYLYKRNSNFRPGHYYSPVANIDEISERQAAIWGPKKLTGIDLNEDTQTEVMTWILENEKRFDIPTKKESHRKYYAESPSYPYSDGAVLHAMVAKYKPKHVIEVGSGASSGCMIDASEQYGLGTKFTLIEPEPQHCLDKVLNSNDYEKSNVALIRKKVQEVLPETFKVLQQNDILFIDSSHVSKPGSDVNFLLTEVLPELNKGVIIHFHDIYYPFEYTKEYLLELKLVWNEAYALHNFLLFNNSFRILFFADYMRTKIAESPTLMNTFHLAKESAFFNGAIRSKNIWIQRV